MIMNISREPFSLEKNIFPYLWKIAYLASYGHLKLRRIRRRYDHPYLYLAGVMSAKLTENSTLFLSSTAKIIGAVRNIHECIELSIELTTLCQQLISSLKQTLYNDSEGYCSSLKREREEQFFLGGAYAPSLRYRNTKLALCICRLENLASIGKNITKKLLQIAIKIFELWQIFSENPQEAQEDIFIEIDELIKKYNVHNSTSLFSMLKREKNEIERRFSSFGLGIEIEPILVKAELLYNRFLVIHECSKIGKSFLVDAGSVLGISSYPTTPSPHSPTSHLSINTQIPPIEPPLLSKFIETVEEDQKKI